MERVDTLQTGLPIILERTRKGKILWTLPTDMKGNSLDTLRGTDSEQETGYYMSYDPDDTSDGGPNISLYGYDPAEDELEMVAEDMFLAEYGSADDKSLLRKIILAARKSLS
jgi:hypothetical protein